MKRLAAVTYNVNGHEMVKMACGYLAENSTPDLTEIVLVDNGSKEPYHMWGCNRLVRYKENVGANALMHRWEKDNWFKRVPHTNPEIFEDTTSLEDEPEFIAFFHADLMVREKGWDARVIQAFDENPKIGLMGFVGSNELCDRGGRGGGTVLNFIGDTYPIFGKQSPASAHGRRSTGLEYAAVLDHCSLIFRTSVLKTLTPQEGNFCPEHFYDRIACCEVLEKGFNVAYLGIACDHFSGGIRDGIEEAKILRHKWLNENGIKFDESDTSPNPATNLRSENVMYMESERRFHNRFRKNWFIPLKVKPDGSIYHQHVSRGGWWNGR